MVGGGLGAVGISAITSDLRRGGDSPEGKRRNLD